MLLMIPRENSPGTNDARTFENFRYKRRFVGAHVNSLGTQKPRYSSDISFVVGRVTVERQNGFARDDVGGGGGGGGVCLFQYSGEPTTVKR